MSEVPEDSVDRQVRAYNEHDVDEFVAGYAEAVVIEDADGSLSGAQIHPSRCPGVFVDQSAKPVAAVELI
jgi:hypothetical protein